MYASFMADVISEPRYVTDQRHEHALVYIREPYHEGKSQISDMSTPRCISGNHIMRVSHRSAT